MAFESIARNHTQPRITAFDAVDFEHSAPRQGELYLMEVVEPTVDDPSVIPKALTVLEFCNKLKECKSTDEFRALNEKYTFRGAYLGTDAKRSPYAPANTAVCLTGWTQLYNYWGTGGGTGDSMYFITICNPDYQIDDGEPLAKRPKGSAVNEHVLIVFVWANSLDNAIYKIFQNEKMRITLEKWEESENLKKMEISVCFISRVGYFEGGADIPQRDSDRNHCCQEFVSLDDFQQSMEKDVGETRGVHLVATSYAIINPEPIVTYSDDNDQEE